MVRTTLYYAAAAWVLAQVLDLLLSAFDASHYMRFVVAGLVRRSTGGSSPDVRPLLVVVGTGSLRRSTGG